MGCQVHMLCSEAIALSGVTVHACSLLDVPAVEAAARSMGSIDVLILGVPPVMDDGPIGTGHNTAQMLEDLTLSGRGNANVLEAALPLMKDGLRRIACITEREASVGASVGAGSMTRHMALAGLNMLCRCQFNRLRPQGYTFRWYAADETPAPVSAAEYILMKLSYHPDEVYSHNEENRLVMRDGFLREIPW